MGRFVVRRGLEAVVVLTVVSVLVFALGRATGDPALSLLPEGATDEQIAALRASLGLDKPLQKQFLDWASGALTGDLGISFRTRRPVSELIVERLPNTLRLGLIAYLTAIVIGLPLGVVAAANRERLIDKTANFVALVGMATPSFWLAIMLVLVFSVNLGWLPTSGTGSLAHFVLPGATIGFGVMFAGAVRLIRSGMLDSLNAEFIKLVRVKGLPERRLIFVHAMRNALIPVVGLLGLYASSILNGAVIVESIFRIPGIGLLAYDAVGWRDFPVLQGVILFVTAGTVFVNLMTDIAYALIDPRIRINDGVTIG